MQLMPEFVSHTAQDFSWPPLSPLQSSPLPLSPLLAPLGVLMQASGVEVPRLGYQAARQAAELATFGRSEVPWQLARGGRGRDAAARLPPVRPPLQALSQARAQESPRKRARREGSPAPQRQRRDGLPAPADWEVLVDAGTFAVPLAEEEASELRRVADVAEAMGQLQAQRAAPAALSAQRLLPAAFWEAEPSQGAAAAAALEELAREGAPSGATPALVPVEAPWQPSQLSATQNATASQVPSPSQGPAAAAALCELARVGAVGPTQALLPAEQPWQPSQLSATQGGEPQLAAADDGSAGARVVAEGARCQPLGMAEASQGVAAAALREMAGLPQALRDAEQMRPLSAAAGLCELACGEAEGEHEQCDCCAGGFPPPRQRLHRVALEVPAAHVVREAGGAASGDERNGAGGSDCCSDGGDHGGESDGESGGGAVEGCHVLVEALDGRNSHVQITGRIQLDGTYSEVGQQLGRLVATGRLTCTAKRTIWDRVIAERDASMAERDGGEGAASQSGRRRRANQRMAAARSGGYGADERTQRVRTGGVAAVDDVDELLLQMHEEAGYELSVVAERLNVVTDENERRELVEELKDIIGDGPQLEPGAVGSEARKCYARAHVLVRDADKEAAASAFLQVMGHGVELCACAACGVRDPSNPANETVTLEGLGEPSQHRLLLALKLSGTFG